MRQFVVIGHDAPTTPDFSLKNLPGAGRLDLLCRCVTSALLLSHDIRTDVRVRLTLADEFTLRFEGSELRGLNPDERSTGALVKNALEQRDEAIGHIPVETSPGVYLSRVGVEQTVREAAEEGVVCQLHEAGTPVTQVEPPENPVFVLSDHRDFRAAEADLLADVSEYRLCLGPQLLHADQAITVAHNWLDTDGFLR